MLSPGAKVNPVLFLEALKHQNNIKNRNIYKLGEENAQILQSIEDEVRAVALEISYQTGMKLDDIPTLKDWFIGCYPDLTQDKSSTQSCMASNSIYCCIQEDFAKGINEQKEQLKSRYLTEQIPYGLVSLKGIAELVDIPTPVMDSVIEKCQKFLDTQFIKNGVLIKNSLKKSGSPQRYDLDVLSKLSRGYLPHTKNHKLETAEFKKNGIAFYGTLLSENSFNEINQKVTEKLENCPEKDREEALLNLHWKDPWFAKFCSRPEFVKAACKLLEDDTVKVFSSIVVVKHPHGKMIVPWHQDAAYHWPIDPIDCASLWLALDDTSVENGAMDGALGGHAVGTLPMEPTRPLLNSEYVFSTQLYNSIPEKTISKFRSIHCTMLRSECSFHHSMMPHTSPPNQTDRRRCAFIVRYCKGNAKLKIYPGMPREAFFKDYQLFDPKEHMQEIAA